MSSVTHALRTWPALIVALATLAFAAPAAHADEQEPVRPAAPAAGSCSADPQQSSATLGADVSYRYVSRRNIYRARPSVGGIVARALPSMRAKRAGVLATQTEHAGQEASYLVLDARQSASGVCWLQLRLPAFPNNKAGWVLRDEVIAERIYWQVEVHLRTRTVVAYRGGVAKLRTRAVIGSRATPTPLSGARAPFAIYDVVRGRPSEFMGAWQVATTALSPQNPRIGRIGLHGRGGQSLRDPIGSARSNGCIRLTNQAVTRLVSLIKLKDIVGVPVVIVA